jgi:hypothetical protein
MNLRQKINERGVSLDEFPDTYLSKRKQDVDKNRTYATAFKEIIGLMKDMSWRDLSWIDGPDSGGTRHVFPLFPEAIRMKIREISRINPNKAKSDFRQGSLAFAKTFDNSEPNTGDTIMMKVESESSLQRSHFPGNGIPAALRGANLGYKLYRSLLQKFKYLRSNTAGTIEKDYAWQSIVSTKKDKQGNLTEDDVHAIVGKSAVFAMIKTIPKAEKIRLATAFINRGEIGKSEITKRNFAIDDELKAILPDSLLAEIDPTRREEAERTRIARETAERAKRDRETLANNRSRFQLYAPYGIDAYDWEVGDYIVVKSYLMDPNYESLPVRKVVEKIGNEYTAIKISDIASWEANGTTLSNDARKTRDKTQWVKTDLQRGQFNYMVDPSAGRLTVKGNAPVAAPISTLAPRRGTHATTTAAVTNNAGVAQEQNAFQRKQVKNFMRGEFNVCIKTTDWDNRAATARLRQPIVTYIVKKVGTGRTATYSVCNGRTGEIQRNMTAADYDALGLKKFNIVQLERKSSVSAGDWVFVKDHRSAQGYACIVKNVTPASNRQPGLYIWTGEDRPQYIGQPPMLWKLVPAVNENLSLSLFRFDEFI